MAHYLKGNRACIQPTSLVFVDTETIATESKVHGRGEVHRLRLWCATSVRWDGERASRRNDGFGETVESFWEWLVGRLSLHRVTWCFAHNWKFDAAVLGFWERRANGTIVIRPMEETPDERTERLARGERKFRGAEITDGVPWFTFASVSGLRCNFVDSLNYYRLPLAAIGTLLSMRKFELPPPESGVQRWRDYCQNDVTILASAMTRLMREWRKENRGNWQPTLPMLAMSCYRHTREDYRLVLSGDPEIQELERRAYYGGENRCFFYGSVGDEKPSLHSSVDAKRPNDMARLRGPVYCLDVCGLYPYVMQRGNFPVEVVGRSCGVDSIGLVEAGGLSGYVASVTRGCLTAESPLRTTSGTAYPRGNFATTLCGAELANLAAHRVRLVVHDTIRYRCAPIFREWVDYWWARRQQAKRDNDGLAEYVAKSMMMALTGKWAQKGRRWRQRSTKHAPAAWSKWVEWDQRLGKNCLHKSVGWDVYCYDGDSYNPNAAPAISAFICAAGREYMRELRSVCPPKSVLYQYTDSLIVTDEGLTALQDHGYVDANQLGKLRIVETIESATFDGVGNWRTPTRRIICGIKPGSVEVSPNKFRQLRFIPSGPDTAEPEGDYVIIRDEVIDRPSRCRYMVVGDDGWADSVVLM